MKSEFIVERQGKTFCLFAGLLDEAHQHGLTEITTTLVQIPSGDNGNVAICTALVRTDRGSFTGIGDASPQNVSRAMLTCLIRMAETRAKARALRDAVNVGVVALDELDATGAGAGIDEEYSSAGTAPVKAPAGTAPAPRPGAARVQPPSMKPPQSADAAPDAMTSAQQTMLRSLLERANRTDSLDGLTRNSANDLIAQLKFELAAATPAGSKS